MKLYNVSFDVNNTDRVLKPRIPESAADVENKTIERVCLADSVAHCIQAIASDNREIKVGTKIIVRAVESSHLSSKWLVSPETLFSRGLVYDALENNEYWYLKPLAFNMALCTITDFDADFTLAWSLIKIEDCKRIVHKYLPNMQVNRYRVSKNLYEAAMRECNRTHNWDAEDEIWDALAELPYSQKIELSKLKLRKEKTLWEI